MKVKTSEILKVLEATPCTFWACEGPDKEPEDMITCNVCCLIYDLRHCKEVEVDHNGLERGGTN